METLSYGQLSLQLHRTSVNRRIPLNGAIEVTRRCPLSCVHCYNNLPMGDLQARNRELTFDEHCRILDEISDAGCLWLLYTGGEILAREDFLDIYSYAKGKGLIISLFSNGTLITSRVADFLAAKRPFAIEISLYGRTRATYERLTGIPGSFDKCMNGIRLLWERRLPLRLKTVAVTTNQHEIEDMKHFAEDELGIEFKFDGMLNPRIDCLPGPSGFRLHPRHLVRLDLQDPVREAALKKFCRQYNGPVHPAGETEELYHCGGGFNSFAIDPEGKLSICVLSRSETYDLRAGDFNDGWQDFLFRIRQKKITRQTKCVRCEIKAMCGMCAAYGELEHGDPESPVDFLCHTAHLKAHGLGFPVPEHGECEYCRGGIASQVT